MKSMGLSAKINIRKGKVSKEVFLAIFFSIPCILFSQARITLQNGYVVEHGGSAGKQIYVVIGNSNPNALVQSNNSWIISENEFDIVQWNIGTATGSYVVPFGYSTSDYIPITCNIASAGIGSGNIRFSTYAGSTWNNLSYAPSDVTNMKDFGATNYSNNAVDRFWILDAQGYSTKPTPDITLTYIRSGAGSEIAPPNYMVENSFITQRFNSSLDEWYDWFGSTGTDVTSGNTGTIKSGTVPSSGFYRSWCIFNDSNLIQGVPGINNAYPSAVIFPNPTTGSFTVSGIIQGQVVELYNSLGQELNSVIATNNSTLNFDISTRANGMYLVRILNKDGSLATQKKIVKTQ